jgi:uncharacterized protein
MDKSTLASFLDPRVFELIVLPTEQCNFRCTYCYEDFEIGQMQTNTVEAVKRLILRRLPKVERFILTWFGGEPLMAKGIVFELCEFAQRECAKAGVQFWSNMTTNAFGLDRATFDTLTQLGMNKYQITLDGDEDEHNKTRKLMNGRATFSKIWGNLLAMRDSKEHFFAKLRLHVHKNNLDSVRELLVRLNTEFGTDPRYLVFMKAVGNWGGESVKQLDLLKDSRAVVAGFQDLLESWGWYAARPYGKNDTEFRPCYAAVPNSLVVRADGSLAKCTVAFSDARNSIGRLNDDGTVELDGDKMKQFMRGFEDGNEDALNCPMKTMPKATEIKVIHFERKADLGERAALPV